MTLTPPAQCQFGSLTGAVTNPDRFTSCNDTVQALIETVNEKPVGAFEFEDQSWATFSASSLQWFHVLSTYGLIAGAYGTLADGAAGVLTNDCNNVIPPLVDPCQAQPAIDTTTVGPETIFLAPGESHLFAWNETDTGSAATGTGNYDVLDNYIGQDWDFSAEKLNNTNENLAGSCDSLGATMNATAVGCVDDQYYPVLDLSLSVYGASAAMIQWAQNNLYSQWGLENGGAPLERMYNPAQSAANNRVICDSTFVNMGTFIGGPMDHDSCDEFPFAATYDSGGTVVTSGSQCVQLSATSNPSYTGTDEALLWNGVMVDGNGTWNKSAACVRAHIPAALNSLVGTAYSRLIRENRLIDHDYFFISVTP